MVKEANVSFTAGAAPKRGVTAGEVELMIAEYQAAVEGDVSRALEKANAVDSFGQRITSAEGNASAALSKANATEGSLTTVNKKQSWFDLSVDFGAKSDGSINDLQSKFNTLQDEDVVFVPKGVFTLKPFTLTNKKNIRFEGVGTIKRDILTSGNFITFDGCDEIFAEIKVDNSNFSNAAIYMKNCPKFNFNKLKVKNLYSATAANIYGVQIAGGCAFGKFDKCEFDNISATVAGGASARAIVVSNFNVTTNHTIGVEINGCKFSNMLDGSDTDAIVIDQLDFYGYHRIIGNQFTDIVKRPVKLMGHGNTARGNRIIHNGVIASSFAVFSSYGNDNSIDDNEAFGLGTNGKWGSFVDCKGSTGIRRNKFFNSSTADVSTANGVYIYDNALGISTVIIEGNDFKNLKYGTNLYTSIPVTNMKINKNTYSGISTHIHYFRSVVTNLEVDGNIVGTSPHTLCNFEMNPTTLSINNNQFSCAWGLMQMPQGRPGNISGKGNVNNGVPVPDYEAGKLVEHKVSIPTTGSYVQGDVVYNKGTDNAVLLWKRLTTGSGHVLNTDWKVY